MNFDPENFAKLLRLDGAYNSNFEGMSNEDLVDAFFGTMDMTNYLMGDPEQTPEFKTGLRAILLEAGSRYALEQILLNGMHFQDQAYQAKKKRDQQRGQTTRLPKAPGTVSRLH